MLVLCLFGSGQLRSLCFFSRNEAKQNNVGGNPANEIKKRFTKEQIEKLLEIKWWNWEIEKITENVENLTSENIESLKN